MQRLLALFPFVRRSRYDAERALRLRACDAAEALGRLYRDEMERRQRAERDVRAETERRIIAERRIEMMQESVVAVCEN